MRFCLSFLQVLAEKRRKDYPLSHSVCVQNNSHILCHAVIRCTKMSLTRIEVPTFFSSFFVLFVSEGEGMGAMIMGELIANGKPLMLIFDPDWQLLEFL